MLHTCAFRWVARTGVAGGGDSVFSSGFVDGRPLPPLDELLGGLHKASGVVYMLRFGFAELRNNTQLNMRDLCTYVDYLVVMLLDLVDSAPLSSQPELVQKIDDAVWAHLKMTMDTLLIQIRDHSQPGHADTLVPLQSSANRLMLLVRLMHDRPMSRKPSPDADDIDLARAAAAADTALAAERLARHDTIRQLSLIHI